MLFKISFILFYTNFDVGLGVEVGVGGWGHCLREVFQTLGDYSLARGLAVHTRFDDRDLVSQANWF